MRKAARYCRLSGSPSAADKEQGLARKALIVKQKRIAAAVLHDRTRVASGMKPKAFKSREYTRCQRCGRPHSVYRKFGLCRICLRAMAHNGEIPGVTKASW